MLFGTAIAYADDWPQFHHDSALSGYTESDGPDTNHLAWSVATGEVIHSSPAIADGILYIATLNGNIYARNAYNGAEVWTHDYGASIYSSPAVDEGRVYFLSLNGTVYAANAATGAMIWSNNIGSGPWNWSSPAVHDGNVFIASSNGLVFSLDGASGAVNWITPIGGEPNSMIAVANGKVYSGTHNMGNYAPTLVALDETTGTIEWAYDYYLSHGGVTGMINCNGVSVADGDSDGNLEVYFGVYNWGGVGPQAICLDEATGIEEWTVSIGGNSTSTPAIHDGVVFIGSDDYQVYALDASNNGAVLWSYPTGSQVWSSPAVADGKVYFGSWDHYFYAVDEATGTLVWSYNTGGSSRIHTSPAIADGFAYICDEMGDIYALRDPLVEVEKHWSETDVCFMQDNDGDGLYDEDGPEYEDGVLLGIDNDGDGAVDEDPVECGGEYSLGTELIPVDDVVQLEAVVKKNGIVSSYNPGQFYAVSTIEVLEDVDTLAITENFAGCADIAELNPKKGGGSVVVVQMVGGVPVQILDAKDEEVTVDVEDGTAIVALQNVSAGTYMVYVKFAPGLTNIGENPEEPCVNYNGALATIGEYGNSGEATAMIVVVDLQ